ncbi:hypothetical protein DNU06_14020 [Putridiphycobacter roseus]|uniref:DUF937 domain-containing protein n=1 Tax=Putridiphycobacter roseus TaxID=2219161 RepID=A0A2W1N019_9FLAO|nr:hypothetical protein [Putridiphycobacter roseus]PZE16241.1 hypothetical protein DNU06_14020 [Putridiphycobacter roseus]
MFGLDDLMKKVDLGDILEKVGLSEQDKAAVTNQAADAVKYRVNKENAKGNVDTIKNLFSQNENTEAANGMAGKLEGDLAFNLKNKLGLDEGIIDQIKSVVMAKFMGGTSNAMAEGGDKEGGSVLDMFGDSDLVNTFKNKLGGLFS